MGSMGVAKQQSDLKRSFSQIYQIDWSIFMDHSERSVSELKKNAANIALHYLHLVSSLLSQDVPTLICQNLKDLLISKSCFLLLVVASN